MKTNGITTRTANYEFHSLEEMGHPSRFIDGKAHHLFSCERRMYENTDARLIANFNKVARWIEENCPNLSGEFNCYHRVYYWIKLVVENGKAYLEEGSHGWGCDIALSLQETAVYSCGSMQGRPIAFKGIQFFRNDRLEEFLKQWQTIKMQVIAENEEQSNAYSEDFMA